MEIVRANTRRSDRGPEDWFSGSVWLEPIGQAPEIVSGRALVGRADGTVEELTAGDTVWFEPAERHWHGASPDGVMVHIAIQEADEDGQQARWEEHVTDEQYGR